MLRRLGGGIYVQTITLLGVIAYYVPEYGKARLQRTQKIECTLCLKQSFKGRCEFIRRISTPGPEGVYPVVEAFMIPLEVAMILRRRHTCEPDDI
jgi:hypothetical protein